MDIFPFNIWWVNVQLCNISPKSPCILNKRWLILVTGSELRMSLVCLLIIGASLSQASLLHVTTEARVPTVQSLSWLSRKQITLSLCSLQRIDTRTIQCRYLELRVEVDTRWTPNMGDNHSHKLIHNDHFSHIHEWCQVILCINVKIRFSLGRLLQRINKNHCIYLLSCSLSQLFNVMIGFINHECLSW